MVKRVDMVEKSLGVPLRRMMTIIGVGRMGKGKGVRRRRQRMLKIATFNKWRKE